MGKIKEEEKRERGKEGKMRNKEEKRGKTWQNGAKLCKMSHFVAVGRRPTHKKEPENSGMTTNMAHFA